MNKLLMLNVPLNILLLSLIWCSLSFADISEGVKSWLKDQGCGVTAGWRLEPVIVEDLKKQDIVEFDKNGENQYGIVWADPTKDSEIVPVDVSGMVDTGVMVLIGVKKTDIKGAVRLIQGNSAFLGPIRPHRFAYSPYGFPHRRNA